MLVIGDGAIEVACVFIVKRGGEVWGIAGWCVLDFCGKKIFRVALFDCSQILAVTGGVVEPYVAGQRLLAIDGLCQPLPNGPVRESRGKGVLHRKTLVCEVEASQGEIG